MVRVFQRPASALSRRAPSRAAKRKPRKHKVILESVTQEKKKLRSVISFEAKAPPGYTFIPAGNPQLSTACKELCRKDGLKIFAVTTTPHMHTHNLSQHVHRIGYHFPSAVVAAVSMDLGLHLTTTGKSMPVQDINTTNKRKPTDSNVSQITINTEARDVLKDLFPNIPDNDLNQIIKTAFQKGQRKVGTAVELPLARRAQLAVVAHIRHVYTDYDCFLKTKSFHEARSQVEEPTLAKLVEWRGDDENGKTVLEDVFREVIVISDDDDSDTEGGETPSFADGDYSVEIISSNRRAEELQTNPVNYANPRLRESQLDLSDDEAPPGFRCIPEVPRRNKIDRRGFSRYQAWDRALNRYRNGANEISQHRLRDGSTVDQRPVYTVPQPLQENIRLDTKPAIQRTLTSRHVSVGPHAIPNSRHIDSGRNMSILQPVMEHRPSELHPIIESSRQKREVIRPNVAPLEQVPVSQQKDRLVQGHISSNAPVFVSGPREFQEGSGSQFGHLSKAPGGSSHKRTHSNPQDRILPSIESPTLPSETKLSNNDQLDHVTRRMSREFTIRSVTPHRLPPQEIPHQGIENSTRDLPPKRRRLAYYEPVRQDDSRSGAPPVPFTDTYTGARYMPMGYTPPSSVTALDETLIRKGYAAPIDGSYVAERPPGKIQDSSSYATHIHPAPEIIVSQRRLQNPGSKPSPRGYYTRPRSPGDFRALSSTNYATSAEDRSDRVIPVHSSNSGPWGAYPDGHRYTVEAVRLREVPKPQAVTWQHDDRILVSDATSKSRMYADDFVRPVGLNDVQQSGSHSQHPRPQASHAAQIPPHPINIQHHHNQSREFLSGDMALSAQSSRRPLDPQMRRATHDHAFVEYRDPGTREHSIYDSSLAPRQYERRGEGPLDSSRPAFENPQHISRTREQHQPTFVRRVEGSPSRYSVPKGRTVVIVD